MNMNIFGKKRSKNRNGLMMSLVGIGIGAAAASMMRRGNGGNNMMEPIRSALDDMRD